MQGKINKSSFYIEMLLSRILELSGSRLSKHSCSLVCVWPSSEILLATIVTSRIGLLLLRQRASRSISSGFRVVFPTVSVHLRPARLLPTVVTMAQRRRSDRIAGRNDRIVSQHYSSLFDASLLCVSLGVGRPRRAKP